MRRFVQGERKEELPPDMLRMANDVLDAWFAFDFELEPGRHPVDAFLEDAELARGERGYLETMRASGMRFYEVIETVPGVSITFRDLLDGPLLTVAERSASRVLATTVVCGDVPCEIGCRGSACEELSVQCAHGPCAVTCDQKHTVHVDCGQSSSCLNHDPPCSTVLHDESSSIDMTSRAKCTHSTECEDSPPGRRLSLGSSPSTARDAIRLAIKLALDETDDDLAARLFEVLRLHREGQLTK